MRSLATLILLFALLLTPLGIKAQNAGNLEKSLLENDNFKIARNYELLAHEFAEKDDLPKAGEYLFKALEIYITAKDIAGKARVIREIAKVQELQHKLRAAAQNFKAAAESATDEAFKTLNLNDYNRLKNSNDRKAQEKYLSANIVLLLQAKKGAEVADAYVQQAQLGLKYNDTVNALDKYEKALTYSNNNAVKAMKIYSEIAKAYVYAKRYDEAVLIVKNLLALARNNKDYTTEIAQLQYLATIYFKLDAAENGINSLKEAYTIAASKGKTFEARESVMQLVEHYKSTENEQEGMAIYEEFLKNLDRIILSDKSLTDAKTFKVTEERIRALENEKLLKDELITRKNTFNYFLLGSMVLLLLLLGFIVKALYAIKTKNKEIALQSLRLEMNPHFLFNSLNSVNQFIAQNNELEANKYLTSYSNLMRNTMENSNKDFVTLGNEIENLTKYLELEHLRFKDKFGFDIKVDESLDPENIWVPNMIIQPHLENAIWHGLRYKDVKGLLKVNFTLKGKSILVTIDDDGIGPTKSGELKTHNQKAHNSRGLTNTKERMMLLNQLYKTKMEFSVNEKPLPQTGTVVTIVLPILYKP
jgi:tetratricopeptide (TPR) repeat protein